jgi:hypothetical protein
VSSPDAADAADAAVDSSDAGVADASLDADAAESSCDSFFQDYDAGPDANACMLSLPCGLPTGITTVGCALYIEGMPFGCFLADDAGCVADAYSPPPDGGVVVDCPVCPAGGGRRPVGLRRRSRRADGSPLATYFAGMAHEEAASVLAFEQMASDLARHRAPVALVRAAERCAADETRHARVMTRHARERGAKAIAPRVRALGPRSLEGVARENLVEGCVRETFGALMLAWQGTHATSPELRATFARLARDETRHAALAHATARWAAKRLDAPSRTRLARAARRALQQLGDEARATVPSVVDAPLGLPRARVRAALVQGLATVLDLGAEPAHAQGRARADRQGTSDARSL